MNRVVQPLESNRAPVHAPSGHASAARHGRLLTPDNANGAAISPAVQLKANGAPTSFRHGFAGLPLHSGETMRNGTPASNPRINSLRPPGGALIQRACASCAEGGSPCAGCDEERKKRSGHETSSGPQAKLIVGPANDAYEQEADRIADRVLQPIVEPVRIADRLTPRVRRQVDIAEEEEEEEENEEEIQTKSHGGSAPSEPISVHPYIQSLHGRGEPLSDALRSFFEPRFGYGFEGVRVHNDSAAQRSAGQLNAKAYTFGRNIVFGTGQYQPHSTQGRGLLAHELTHVVQQGAATRSAATAFRADGAAGTSSVQPLRTSATGTPSARIKAKLIVGAPGDRFELEADHVAEAVVRAPDPFVRKQAPFARPEALARAGFAGDARDLPVRRRPIEEEEESLQPGELTGQAIQRQPRDGEEEEDEEEELLQAKETPGQVAEVNTALADRIGNMKGRGRPLTASERAFFEPRFGHDFSHVRVHTDAEASEVARNVRARAFTVGQDVVFGEGQFKPTTSAGRLLLAHELTHTLQQASSTQRPSLGPLPVPLARSPTRPIVVSRDAPQKLARQEETPRRPSSAEITLSFLKGVFEGLEKELSDADYKNLKLQLFFFFLKSDRFSESFLRGLKDGVHEEIKGIVETIEKADEILDELAALLLEILLMPDLADVAHALGAKLGEGMAQRVVALSKKQDAAFDYELGKIAGPYLLEAVFSIVLGGATGVLAKAVTTLSKQLPKAFKKLKRLAKLWKRAKRAAGKPKPRTKKPKTRQPKKKTEAGEPDGTAPTPVQKQARDSVNWVLERARKGSYRTDGAKKSARKVLNDALEKSGYPESRKAKILQELEDLMAGKQTATPGKKAGTPDKKAAKPKKKIGKTKAPTKQQMQARDSVDWVLDRARKGMYNEPEAQESARSVLQKALKNSGYNEAKQAAILKQLDNLMGTSGKKTAPRKAPSSEKAPAAAKKPPIKSVAQEARERIKQQVASRKEMIHKQQKDLAETRRVVNEEIKDTLHRIRRAEKGDTTAGDLKALRQKHEALKKENLKLAERGEKLGDEWIDEHNKLKVADAEYLKSLDSKMRAHPDWQAAKTRANGQDEIFGGKPDQHEMEHIVPRQRIINMKGFLDDLTPEQQVTIFARQDNLIGMGATANKARGTTRYGNWTSWRRFVNNTKPVEEVEREIRKLAKREVELEAKIQAQIAEFVMGNP